MGEQYALAPELGDHWIAQQAAAAARTEAGAEQEVAIAVEGEARDAAASELAQRAAHTLIARLLIVVADPRLEQVTEDVERLGRGCLSAQEVQKLLGGFRGGGIQMHVRDEEQRHAVTWAKVWCSVRAD